MQCTNPVRLTRKIDPSVHPDGLLVPCGKCLACRIKKRSEWSMRMLHELDDWDDAVFLTLTYDNDHLPPNGSLVWTDLQKFFKRLRRRLSNEDRSIKYFACGEYGDKTFRPHYHAIVFGLSLRPEDKQLVMDAWRYCDWSVQAIADRAFGLAEVDSIRYVAQYIDKKLSGEERDRWIRSGREPVFRLLSLGIGRNYCDRNANMLSDNGYVNFKGCKTSLPRYYVDRLLKSGCGINVDNKDKVIEEDKDVSEHYIGRRVTELEALRVLDVCEFYELQDKRLAARAQADLNFKAKMALRESKI